MERLAGPIVVTVAVEGDMDEAVLRRLAALTRVEIGRVHGRNGKQRLLNNMRAYNNAARHAPWVVLLDLDHDDECAPPCVRGWLPEPAPNMCLRVAVRAIEAWLLADRERIADYLGVSEAVIPRQPDNIDDPKRHLVNLARRSRKRSVRDDIVPREGSGRAVGPLYVSRMRQFIEDRSGGWRPESAATVSDSLARTVRRLAGFGRGAG